MQKTVLLFMTVACLTLIFLPVKFIYANPPDQTPAAMDQSPVDTRTELSDPLGAGGDFPTIANRMITGTLGFTGVLALIAFIWGGIEWMTSGGNEPKIEKGKKMMVWAVLGLAIIFSSYAILTFVFDALGVAKAIS